MVSALLRLSWFPVSLLTAVSILTTIGCKAQVPPTGSTIQDAALVRKIEVEIRSQFNIPSEYDVKVGTRGPSDLPGFDSLTITISHNGNTSTSHFLISKDNNTLARMEKFDLNNIAGQHIPVADRPIRGNPDAKVTVITFDDLECPYCARMHQQLFPETLEHYKDKVRFIYKDDPLVEIHPWALHAAVNANCIAAQNSNAYWGYVDYLHAHGEEVTGPDRDVKKSYETLDRIAREQGKIFKLDAPKLDACIQKQDESVVRASMKEAENLGIEGTPYLFIDGEHIDGAQPLPQVWAAIDRALRAAGVEPPPADAPAPAPTLGH